MKVLEEIKIDFSKVDEEIAKLQQLQVRAATCSSVKFDMPLSKGEPKEVLLDAYESMSSFAGTVSIMLKDIINDLNYTKERMKQEDNLLAGKMTHN
jgi:uncharacterized FlgJ-related protein